MGWQNLVIGLNDIFNYKEFEAFDLHWQWTIIPHAIFIFLWNASSRSNSLFYRLDLTFFAIIFLGIFLTCAYAYWYTWLLKLFRARTKLSMFFTVPLSAGIVVLVVFLMNTLFFSLLRLYFSEK